MIYVAIPTYKRPKSLSRLIKSLGRMSTAREYRILVADNDAEMREGVGVAKSLSASEEKAIDTIVVEARGISAVRNAILEYVFRDKEAEILLMIDDDEYVDPGWIDGMLTVQTETAADAVAGLVLPHFETTPPDFAKDNELYWRTKHDSGIVRDIYSTTSLLLARKFFREHKGFRFLDEFGMTGGGDFEFLNRMKGKGAVFAFASSAISYEVFGESRLTKDWNIERSYRIGFAEARIAVKNRSYYRLFLKSFLAYFYYRTKVFLYPSEFQYERKMVKQLGRMKGRWAQAPEVYKKIHGG
ncbi:MAG: glycosyltransferase [Pseudomonadota bacterium]|nr:glycosyltransferase [Pseudomonadota bacterium]